MPLRVCVRSELLFLSVSEMSTLASPRCQNTAKVEASLPEGFQDQLNQVVRAVLLGQPTQHICTFIADFLEAQLDDRVQREQTANDTSPKR